MPNDSEWALHHVLDESPFFVALSISEKQELMKELLRTYPELSGYAGAEHEIGYESAGWVQPNRANDAF